MRIRGLGVICEAVLELHQGFTVLTGETGAGKTMVVTGLHLLGGGRAEASRVRAGSDRAVVEGWFTAPADGRTATTLAEVLDGADAELDENGSLICARTITADGRSRAHLGGRSVPAAALAEISEHLLAVHGQNDQLRLTRPGEQRAVLDRFAGDALAGPLSRYREIRQEWLRVATELTERTERARELAREADLLRHGLDEIAVVDPKPGEDVELIAEARRLSDVDELRAAAEQARQEVSGSVDGDPDYPGAAGQIAEARKRLSTADDPALRAMEPRLAEAAVLVGDVAAELGGYLDELEADPARLEQVLALGRLSWPLSVIRALADKLLALSYGRRKNPPHEVRWLNLTGFCLRPGFGFPGDDFRIEQARRIYASGLTFPNQIQNEIDWWIFCGRIAGGFNRNQQGDIFQRLSPILFPKQKKRPRINQSLYREMWRAAASLELLPQQTKAQLAESSLLEMVKRGEMVETALWCLSRLGARRLFSGPINLVLSPSVVSRWIETLLRLPTTPALLESVVHMAEQTGDVARDLTPATLQLVRRSCESSPRSSELLRQLSGEDHDLAAHSRIFGEELPAGLVLVTSAAE